jgi:hypothetical protein
LQLLFENNAFLGYAFDAPTFEQMKSIRENATCEPNGFVVIFPRVAA